MNPCLCGFSNDPVKECTCSPNEVSRYRKRISGPLLDRIDLFVEVPRIEYEELVTSTKAESSATVRERIEGSRERQWSGCGDSKSGPPRPERGALPTALHPEMILRAESL